MAILVDTETRLVVQGLTGSEGRFHGLRNRSHGAHVVAGVTPRQGGQDDGGHPVFGPGRTQASSFCNKLRDLSTILFQVGTGAAGIAAVTR